MIRLAVIFGAVGGWHAVPAGRRHWLAIAAIAAVSVPLAALVLIAGLSGRLLRQVRKRRGVTEVTSEELSLLGELALLGLTAGLPFPASLSQAASRLGGPLRQEVTSLVRRARTSGVGLALAGSDGAASGLYLAVARAMSTGAPVAAAVQAFVSEQDARARHERLLAAQRLPVKLVIPLALLILPGFVLLTVAPALVGAFERFAL